jgi:hypothetical protein
MDTNPNMHVAIATLCVSYLMSKFNLNTIYYGMLYGVILQLLVWVNTKHFEFQFDSNINYYIYYILMLFGLSGIGFLSVVLIKKYTQPEYTLIKVINSCDIESFKFYIKEHPEFYDKNININAGDIKGRLNNIVYNTDIIYSHVFP